MAEQAGQSRAEQSEAAAFRTDSEEAAQRNRLVFIRAGIVVLAVGSLLGTAVLVAIGQWQRAPLVLTYVVVGVSTWYLLSTGRIRAGFQVGLYGTWASIVIGLILINGLEGPTVSVFPALLLLAGWVVGLRATWFLKIAT